MKIPAYWCDIHNFGDELNVDIFMRLAKIKLEKAKMNSAALIGIGSLLDNLLLDNNKSRKNPLTINIFTSGFGFEEGGFFHNPHIVFPEKLKRNVWCWALRGKLSQKRIEKILGHKIDAVLGDGGLLSSYLIDKEKIEQIYDLGIVPHYADYDDPIFTSLQKHIPNSCILDITQPPITFLENLCRCKMVVSTAMHPLIACDALHIPNLWIRISEKTTSRFKFYDYYSVYNLKPEPYDLKAKGIHSLSTKFIQQNYKIEADCVEKIKTELLSTLYQMKRKIFREILLYRIFKFYMISRKLILRSISLIMPIKAWRRKLREKE